MKKIMIIMALVCSAAMTAYSQKYRAVDEMYIYGVATSNVDSTIYLTDIQKVSGTYEEKKTHFLYARNEYSIQLTSYLKQQGFMSHPMSSVSYATKKKKIDKKMEKLRKKLSKDGYLVKIVPVSVFQFKGIEYSAPEVEETPAQEKKPEKPQGRPEGRPQGGPQGGPGGGMPPAGGPGGGMQPMH